MMRDRAFMGMVLFCCFPVIGFPVGVFSEWLDGRIEVESDLELERLEDQGDISETVARDLGDFFDNPVPVNDADITELSALPGMDRESARKIVQERGSHETYRNFGDLTDRTGILEEKLIRIKPLITFDRRAAGELLVERVSQSLPGLVPVGGVLSDVSDREVARLKVSGIGNEFQLGGSFLRNRFAVMNGAVQNGRHFIEETRQIRWMKGYLGYHHSGDGFLRQFFLGNYRLGFFERVRGQGSSSIMPDDRLPSRRSIEIGTVRKRNAPMRGVAVKTGGKEVYFTGFYSRDKVPSSFPAIRKNLETGLTNTANAAVIDNILDIEMLGGYFAYDPLPSGQAGLFWIHTEARYDIPFHPITAARSSLWGIRGKGRFGGANIHTLVSRSYSPDGGFYFVRIHSKAGSDTELAFLYERNDPGYLNLAGGVFSGNFLWAARFQIHQRVRNNLDVDLDVSREIRRDQSLMGIRYKAGWQTGGLTVLKFGQSYREGMEFGHGTTGVLKTREIRSDFKVVHDVFERLENQIGFELRNKKILESPGWRAGQAMFYRVVVPFKKRTRFRGGLRYEDRDIHRSGDETESLRLEIFSKVLRNLEWRVVWQSVVRRKESQNISQRDTFRFRAIVRW